MPRHCITEFLDDFTRHGRQMAYVADIQNAGGEQAHGDPRPWLVSPSHVAHEAIGAGDARDPSGLGRYENWAWNWPANRRVLYNRASADQEGKPWDPTRSGITWNGALHQQTSSPVAPVFHGDMDKLGTPQDGFDIVATTFRLTEHFHYWTKHVAPLAMLQSEFFVEIPEGLALERRIKNEDLVRVSTPRGAIEGRALVTKRIRPMKVAGKAVWQVAIPIHWGFQGRTDKGNGAVKGGRGPMANLLTASVVDPNSFTPEYKTFLVKLEKVST